MQPMQTTSGHAVAYTPAERTSGGAVPVKPPSGRHRFGLKAARAFCEALFSTADGPAPPDRITWLMGELDALFESAGWRSAGFYKLALIVSNLLAPLLIGRIGPLWRLSLADRVRALTRLEHSPLASVVLASKSMICIIYYEHPDSAKEIGFVRPERERGAR